MNASIRWRIFVLQVFVIAVLAFGAGAGFYASNFTHQQVHDQLAPQQISFPASQQAGLPANLQQYAGQQVLDGYQAHAYAEKFIGLNLSTIGKGHPYSYWSGQAMAATDPTVKATDQGIADTLFKGETLRSMLNQAWTFWVIGDIAFWAAIGFSVATVLVLASLVFEVVSASRSSGKTTPEMKLQAAA
jgi:hypothetical protein